MVQNWTIYLQLVEHGANVAQNVFVLLAGEVRDLAAAHGRVLAGLGGDGAYRPAYRFVAYQRFAPFSEYFSFVVCRVLGELNRPGGLYLDTQLVQAPFRKQFVTTGLLLSRSA